MLHCKECDKIAGMDGTREGINIYSTDNSLKKTAVLKAAKPKNHGCTSVLSCMHDIS